MENNEANGADVDASQQIDEHPVQASEYGTPFEPLKAQPVQDGPTATPASTRLRNVTDASLRFFANASNETLGACAVGLCASTYLVLGRVGLVLIGAVGGIVFHATWENQLNGTRDGQSSIGESNRRRRELSAEVVKRVLDWRQARKDGSEDVHPIDIQVEESVPTQIPDYSEYKPATGAALAGFTDAVIRDYVKWWYCPLLPTETSFPAACRQTLTSFIYSISNHLSRKRPVDPFLDFLANSTSIIIVFLNELSAALKASQRQEPEDAVRTYLKYQPESNLANVLSPQQQDRKLNLVADDILHNFVDSNAYNFPPAKVFLREILAGLVLKTTITTCSKPEWINGWIVYLLEDGEPELMNVIDAGVSNMGEMMADTQSRAASGSKQDKGHQRRVSRAEEAMQEAMLEAKRLNEMIAEEDARKKRDASLAEGEDPPLTATTEEGIATPTSSDSDLNRQSMESSMIFDSDGNALHPISPSKKTSSPSITFDQLGMPPVPTILPTQYTPAPIVDVSTPLPSLTLQNAVITIFDDADPSERSLLRQRPMSDYLLQIEPASSRFPGWMIPRKYVEFEALHESLRRIAIISGVPAFAQKYVNLPGWKGQSRVHLVSSLEGYLREALQSERLAESEAMKKFLEKETGLAKAPAQPKNVLVQGSAALENVGKGFINVLGQGGKGIAGGGKAVLGGVQGVFGAVAKEVGGPKRPTAGTTRSSQNVPTTASPKAESYSERMSQDLPRTSTSLSEVSRTPPLPARPIPKSTERGVTSRSSSQSREAQYPENLHLPPPPSEVLDDYVPLKQSHTPGMPGTPPTGTPSRPATPTIDSQPSPNIPLPAPAQSRKDAPLTEEETRVSIELMFAIITELYSLSSAWTIRLSLLSAAKTFLLRPNNPQLESIRLLLQGSIIDSNSSDVGLAAHIHKLRENTLPTEEELKKWPAEMSPEEKEKLRTKARRLLVERGMPQALTSVMGQAASGEALGKVFDCLQMEEVARGLIFALLLQALRAATQ